MSKPVYEVAIIGAGPGGIAAGRLLRKKGITDFVILERADDFGGTWRDNHYPGLAVDIPSLWYQLSFNPNPEWTRLFAPGPELYRYFQDTARQLGLYEHLHANSEVVQQKWDDASGLWRLAVRDQPAVTARFVISSVGGYVNAKTKIDIDGIDDFEGTVLRPNAWDDDYDTRGKRIAVIGTGSSGVQIAAALSEQAESLDVYQRTPGWVLPKIDFELVSHGHYDHRGRECARPGLDGRLHGGADRAPAPPAAEHGSGPDPAAVRQVVPAVVPHAASRDRRRPRPPKGARPPHWNPGQAPRHFQRVLQGAEQSQHRADHHRDRSDHPQRGAHRRRRGTRGRSHRGGHRL